MQISDGTRRRTVYVAAAAVVVGIAAASWRQPLAGSGAGTVAAAGDASADTAADSAADSEAETAEESQSKYQEYVVQEGDTVGSVAEAFGLEPDSILYTNGLSEDDVLQVGQTLIIPSVDGVVYEVQDGDTLWNIATDYGVTEDEVVEANPDIDPEGIQPGEVVLVPGGKPTYERQVVSRGGGSDRSESRSSGGTISYWPVYGILTDSYGWRIHPVYGTEGFHDGMDISVPYGTPVVAAASGYVTMAAYNGSYGYTVRIDHGGGLSTDYCHLSEFAVSVGDWVDGGQVIAYSGNSGVTTGPHLHFMVRVWGTTDDPANWLP